MKIINLTQNEYGEYGYSSNCYLLTAKTEAAVVDPSVSSETVLSAVKTEGATLKYIILTHGHFDHMHTTDELRDLTGAEVMIHSADAMALTDPDISLFRYFGFPEVVFREADRLLSDGDEIALGDEIIRVVHTPGHTPGCICLLCGDDMLTGDTIFDMSVGRYDFPRSDGIELRNSIVRLYKEYAHTRIHPGHGPSSTMAKQMEQNPMTRGLANR